MRSALRRRVLLGTYAATPTRGNMATRARHIDLATLAVIAITLALFALAVVEKGLTRDLLLEAGVFLVSVKLMLMSAKASLTAEETRARLDVIQSVLERLESSSDR